MTNTAKALNAFWSSFGLPAYPEDNVPERTADGRPLSPPYITYALIEPNWDAPVSTYARVWYRSEGYEAIHAKIDEIAARIPAGTGVRVLTDGGFLWLNRGTPWAQDQPTLDRYLKVAYLNMQLNAYTT